MALVLNGSSQYGRFPNQTDANSVYYNSVAYSLAVWFKPDGQATVGHIAGTDAGTGSGVTRFTGVAYRGDSGNKLAYYRSSVTTYHDIQTSSGNAWQLVVITRPAGSPSTVTAATTTIDTTLASTFGSADYESHGFSIGARMNASSVVSTYFAGKIAEFAIWKGRELSAAEIDSLQGGARLNTISTGLTEYIDLTATSSGTATTATSTSGKVMTFTGSPTYDGDSPFITASVTDVNGNDVVLSGGAVSITTAAIPSATGATVGGKALTGFSGSNNAYSGIMPSMADGQTYPAYGTQSLAVINGTNNPTISVTLNTATTDTYITVSGVNTSFGTIAYEAGLVGLTINNGDTLTYKLPASLGVANNLILADTSIETDVEGTQIVYHRNNSTGMVTQLNITTGSGVIVHVGLTTTGLSSQGLTTSGLTTTGL